MRLYRIIAFTVMLGLTSGSGATALADGGITAARPATRHGFVDLGTLGGRQSYGWAVNDRGEVVGSADTGTGYRHATMWRRGERVDLGALDAPALLVFSMANDINNRGDVVGESVYADGNRHAILWRDGAMTDLGSPGRSSSAWKVNERGDVLGSLQHVDGTTTAMLWSDGRVTDIGFPDAVDLNDRGHVLGFTQDVNGRPLAFMWRRGTIEYLPMPAGYTAYPMAMNNSGWVVYRVLDQAGVSSAVLWHDGVFSDLDGLGGPVRGETMPLAVNDRGEVLGYSVDPMKGWIHAIVWRHGTIYDLTNLGVPVDTVFRSLNDNGQATGWYPTEEGEHAAMWR